jgi:hypothetical protein
MEPPDDTPAVMAATSIPEELSLRVENVSVLQNSNKLALRLLPCDVFARVAHVGREVARFEVEIAQRLAETGSPVAALDPRVEPRTHERDGFVVTLWTYYEPVVDRRVSAVEYAKALARLHAGMRKLDIATPHFTDRVEEAQRLVGSRELTPDLAGDDRDVLVDRLRRLTGVIAAYDAHEQLLHGEPHPGNVVGAESGVVFVDLETCCRGPVEFDLAHVPVEVSKRYPNVDHNLLHDCRGLVLAIVAAWRWDKGDQLPNGQYARRQLLAALREGPPWPAIDIVMPT